MSGMELEKLEEEEEEVGEEDESPIYRLPPETLHQIFSSLPLKQITISKSLSKFFHRTLTSPSFHHLLSTQPPPLNLLALRQSHHHHLHAFDPASDRWFNFSLTFLPFRSPSPVASSCGLVYLWAESLHHSPQSPLAKSLVVCNPLTRRFRILPQLGSAWSRHGSVLVSPPDRVLVLTELATLYLAPTLDHWLNFSSNLPAKPRSPILVNDWLYALCDVGSPWRNQWKLYTCALTAKPRRSAQSWSRLEMHKWGDVFDVLKRPRLVPGIGNNLLMVGGLKASFALHAPCSAIVVLRLDLDSLEWTEAARMPAEMFMCFQESSKFKVFGGGNRVCFSGKRVGKLALWQGGKEVDNEDGSKDGQWRWIEGVPGNREGSCRGFIFEASLCDLP